MTTADRMLAGMAAAYFAYRLWSGWGEGIIYGDGDMDVRVNEHPTAFVLTALSIILVVVILACIAIGSDAGKLASFVGWLWKL
jgi:spore coat protein U-like protein